MNKILLNNKSKNDVLKDSSFKINLNNINRILPNNDLNKVLNVGDQFNLEQNSSTKYRIGLTINSLFTNVLFNTTGPNSLSSFMDNNFRDKSYPKNGVDLNNGDLSYSNSIRNNLKCVDGWYGFTNPELFSPNMCVFTDMEPNRELFSLTPKNNIKNWDFTITYPYENRNGFLVDNGLFVFDKKDISISGRNMSCLGLPIKHNLNQGDKVVLSGLSPNIYNGEYDVINLGLDNGDYKDYYFSIDLDSTLFNINNCRVKKIINGKESNYYYRWFKKIKTTLNSEIENDDYLIYNLAFSQNIYNDKISQLIVNEDIDVSNLVDNFNRPISEFFITFMKKPNNGFSNIKSGIYIPFYSNIINSNIPDIDLVTNNSISSNNEIESNVLITNNDFFGDIIEYNDYELVEFVLSESYHRFNTINRETGGVLVDPINNSVINMGVRHEGYTYKPNFRVKIREFSNYIEQGDLSVLNVPDYAVDLLDGRLLWRDIIDINQSTINLPFLNGCHYVHENIILNLRRQDPRGINGLFYGDFPSDKIADTLEDNLVTKTVNDAC